MKKLLIGAFLISSCVYAENYTIVNLGGNKYITGDQGYQGTGYRMGESYYFQDSRGNQITKLNDTLTIVSTQKSPDDLFILNVYEEIKDKQDEPRPIIETASSDEE
jgi:uncharacterized protein YxjI